MCDFLSADVCRDGRIVCDGVHGHTELARRDIAGENGIGRQRFWEWELPPTKWGNVQDPLVPLRAADCNLLPEPVLDASLRLLRELSSLDGVSTILPWLAVLRTGQHEYMPSTVRIIVLAGRAHLDFADGAQTVMCMLDSSRVGEMLNSSQVGKMWDSSQVVKKNH